MGSNIGKLLPKSVEKPSSLNSSVALSSNSEQPDVTFESVDSDEKLDPRSPHVCRTPMQDVLKAKYPMSKIQNLTEVYNVDPQISPQNGSFAEKLVKQLNYNLLDPRSPSQFIDRTPIVFDEETELPIYGDADHEACGDKTADSLIGVYEKSFANEELRVETPKGDLDVRDPRSPTEGVERTPIVFSDENSEDNNETLECIIEKFEKTELQNKHLDRVKNPRHRVPRRVLRNRTIYEDKSPQVNTPPKRALENNSSTPKRTPLSCVANKSHLRSKSVENSTKPLSNKVQMSSYDDYNLKMRQSIVASGENTQTLSARRLNI